MDLDEVMRTTFACRDHLPDPVDDATLYRVLERARFAPSGGNRQPARVIVVRDQATRDALRPMLGPTWKRYVSQKKAGENPLNPIVPSAVSEADIAAMEMPEGAVDWLVNAPVLLFVFLDLSKVAVTDIDAEPVNVVPGCSIYPLVQNILLSARNEGLGGVPTTWIGAAQDQLKELLGVPDPWAFASMIPLGKPRKQLTKLTRGPVEEFVRLERFQGPGLSS